jgi:tetratricopeptide (TPR) repeat protein
MTKRSMQLILLAGLLGVAGLVFWKRFGADLSPPAANSEMSAADNRILDAMEAAEKISDPQTRCRKYPNPAQTHWSHKLVDAFCADVFTPRFSWEEVSAAIKAGNGRELDDRYDKFVESYFSGGTPEGSLHFAYQDYQGLQPDAAKWLDRWLEQSPQSAHALAARGIYHIARAHGYRGESPYREVTPENRAKMHEEVGLGRADVERALAINPRILPAYASLIHADLFAGNLDDAREILARAKAIDPITYYVRATIAMNYQARWGGSQQLRDELAEEAQSLRDRNPRMANIATLIAGNDAMQPYFAHDYKRALELFDRALEHGPEIFNLNLASASADEAGQPLRVVEYCGQMARFKKIGTSAILRRSRALDALHRFDWAKADLDFVLSYDPKNTYATHQYASLLIDRGDFAGAADRLKSERADKRDDHWTNQTLAFVYLYDLKDFAAAAPLIDELLRANDKDGAAWLLRADLLDDTNQPGVREALEKFLSSADRSSAWQAGAIPKARAWLGSH